MYATIDFTPDAGGAKSISVITRDGDARQKVKIVLRYEGQQTEREVLLNKYEALSLAGLLKAGAEEV